MFGEIISKTVEIYMNFLTSLAEALPKFIVFLSIAGVFYIAYLIW